MQITLDDVSVGAGIDAPVPPLSLIVEPGAPVVVAVETDERPMHVSLLIGGRLRADSGAVLVDGAPASFDDLRERTALVDTPFVADADPDALFGRVVAEELSFAERASGRRAVREFLANAGATDYEKVAVSLVPPALRIRLNCELALLRDGVETLVITSPERHGGNPVEWFGELRAISDRGIAVVVVTDAATERSLLQLGARDGVALYEAAAARAAAEAAAAEAAAIAAAAASAPESSVESVSESRPV